MLRLSFLGGAGCVTGSRYLLEANGARLLVDCGLNQERDLASRNWDPLPVPAGRIDAMLLTHAHLDHCGLLPRAVRQGFRGAVWCTAPTAEIGRIVMTDSARLQLEDAEKKRQRHEREGRSALHLPQPLYTEEDAERAGARFALTGYGRTVAVADGVSAEFLEAGHILGSACIRVRAAGRTILFSGDIGRWGKPFLNDPAPCGEADYALMESTYGDSVHEPDERIAPTLRDLIVSTLEAGGNLVIPSFAIERSQELLYWLSRLQRSGQVPRLPIFLDSPMGVRVSEVFEHHPEYLDAEMRALLATGDSPFDLPGLVMSRTVADSKAINAIRGTAVIIAGAGMCTGGRIKHHLLHNIGRPESTILFVGYQASGTLGREILEGAPEVRILGQRVGVRARVARIGSFSAHADREELARWAEGFAGKPRQCFIVHGEPAVAAHFRAFLSARRGWRAVVPAAGDAVELD